MTDDPFEAIGPGAETKPFTGRVRTWGKKERLLDPLGNSGAKPKKIDPNPFQRKWFAKGGWAFERVEKTNAYGSVTVDLWGFGDYIAVHPEHGIWLFQTTTHGHAAEREAKARSKPELRAWLMAGGHFAVHGWEQPKGKGTAWVPVERIVTLEDLDSGQKRFKR